MKFLPTLICSTTLLFSVASFANETPAEASEQAASSATTSQTPQVTDANNVIVTTQDDLTNNPSLSSPSPTSTESAAELPEVSPTIADDTDTDPNTSTNPQ